MAKPRSKYFSHKFTDSEGVKWDSNLESDRYQFLLRCQQAGIIYGLNRQYKFTLLPNQTITIPRTGKRGTPIKPIVRVLEKKATYRADFTYRMPDGTLVVEDTKSKITRTADYRIKKKMMLFFHHIRIREVERSEKHSQPGPPQL